MRCKQAQPNPPPPPEAPRRRQNLREGWEEEGVKGGELLCRRALPSRQPISGRVQCEYKEGMHCFSLSIVEPDAEIVADEDEV
jgi:hypothetical protein